MTCDDEAVKVDTRWDAVEEADIELAKARQKVENRLKGSLAACGLGALGGLSGQIYVLIGLGATCLGALLTADDAAIDYEYAVAISRLAHERHAKAVLEELLCLAHCEFPDS